MWFTSQVLFSSHFLTSITFFSTLEIQNLNIKNVKVIPDGNCDFTRAMGMEVKKNNLGFGARSWRYAVVINDGKVEKIFEEPGKSDNFAEDPYDVTSPDNILSYLTSKEKKTA